MTGIFETDGEGNPLNEGVYYYEEGGALRIITDDGELYIHPAISEPGSVFLSIGDLDQGQAEFLFLVKPQLTGAIAAYLQVFADMWEETQDALNQEEAEDE